MFVKILYYDENRELLYKVYENTQNISGTKDGIAIESGHNKYDIYLHSHIHSIEIRQEKPSQ